MEDNLRTTNEVSQRQRELPWDLSGNRSATNAQFTDNRGPGAPMSIQRVPDVPFAQIANSALRDKRLSFKARGVLALVLSNVGEWEATLRWLINQSDRDGRHAIQQALNELTECGYREVRKCIIDGVATTVVEWRHEPISRLTENPTVGKSDDRETGVSYRTPSNRTPLEEHHPKKGATSAPSDDNRLAQEITKTYTDRVPLSKFVAVLGIVKRALKADYTAEQITDALAALADEGRPVTVDTLRIQMEGGLPAAKSKSQTRMERNVAAMANWEPIQQHEWWELTPAAQGIKEVGR